MEQMILNVNTMMSISPALAVHGYDSVLYRDKARGWGKLGRSWPCALSASFALAVVGCSSGPAAVVEIHPLDQPALMGQASSAIIRGLLAPSAELDHTGALLYRVRA